MKVFKGKQRLLSFLLGLVLATELVLLADCVGVCFGLRLTPMVFAGAWAAAAVAVPVLTRKAPVKKLLICVCALIAAAGVAALLGFGIWRSFIGDAAYRYADDGKGALYADREIMVIVPHQDDELNILGGVLEEFTRYGSRVRVVFSTNGDRDGIPQTRLEEAIAYCANLGIPEENVIFLGYGDGWDPGPEIHLYNAPDQTVVTSHFGRDQTYGLEGHPAYREGNAYTRENLLGDLKAVILEHRPEWIFCIDYDDHIEHQALSLAFEKTMGKLLREEPGYRPVVWKAYAYGTAWYAKPDFYGENIRSTQDPYTTSESWAPEVYRWEDRVRFPVAGQTLSRSLAASEAYRTLDLYHSQKTWYMARNFINGDRVFWQRRTDSLLLGARVEVSSGEAGVLTDFMLLENRDLWHQQEADDGVWTPEGEDPAPQVTVTLDRDTAIDRIVLYDNPAEEDNVLDAVIALDDGTTLRTGPLHPTGAATVIPLEGRPVRSFTVTLAEVRGENPGLTEIEAFGSETQGDVQVAKLQDANGDFVYDYRMPPEGRAAFTLYTYGVLPQTVGVRSDNEAVLADWQGGVLSVTCPEGEAAIVTVTLEEAGLSDCVYVSNPGKLRRLHTALGQWVEEYGIYRFYDTITARLLRMAGRLLG